MDTLNPDAATPLYRQLKTWLIGCIRNSVWLPNAILPSERDLCQSFGVSRATIRQAIAELEREGWVVKKHGKGTFVAPAKVAQPLARLSGFSENMRQLGIGASSRVMSQELAEPSPAVRQALALAPGDVVAVVTRLRYANTLPLMLERSHLNYALTPGLLAHDLSGSLYHLLGEVYRLRLAEGEESLEVQSADATTAKLLGLKRGAPLLYTERVVLLETGVPVEFAQRYARADQCKFVVSLRGDQADFTLKNALVNTVEDFAKDVTA